MTEFEALLQRLQSHFTPSEFVEFLLIRWDVLLDNEQILNQIEEYSEELNEEIGIE